MAKRQWIVEPQTQGTGSQLKYAANSTQTLTIGAKPFILAGLQLDWVMNKTGSSDACYQDYFFRAPTGLQLTGMGKNYLSYNSPDLRALYWHNRLKEQHRNRVPDFIAGGTTGSPKQIVYSMPILFHPHPVRYDDQLSMFGSRAGIITSDDLQLSVTWGAATAWGSTGTPSIYSGYCQVTYIGYTPVNDSEVPKWYPEYTIQQLAPTQTYTGWQWLNYIPVGWWYRRLTYMCVNGSQGSADDRLDGVGTTGITQVGLQTADGRQPLKMQLISAAQASQVNFDIADDNTAQQGASAAYGTSTSVVPYNAGVFQWDMSQIADESDTANASADFGINLVGKDPSTLAFASTVASTSNTYVYGHYERYKPY